MATSRINKKTTTLDPNEIFGFTTAVEQYADSGKLNIEQHPLIPNPRTEITEESMNIINNVAESGNITTPIVVTEWQGEIIVLDGRTRLMGAVKASTTEETKFDKVPVTYHPISSVEEGLALALRMNIERVNLDENALLLLLGTLHNQDPKGYTPQVLAQLIGRDHKGGVRYVKSAIKAFNSPALRKNVEDRTLPADVARQVSSRHDSEEEIEKAVDKTVRRAAKVRQEAQEKGKEISQEAAVKKAAKATKASRSNHTALPLPDLRHRIAQALTEMCSTTYASAADRKLMQEWLVSIVEGDEDTEVTEWPAFEGQDAYQVLMARVITLAEAANYAVETIEASNLYPRIPHTIRNVWDNMSKDERATVMAWRQS